MIEHIVLFRWTSDTLPEQIEEALVGLRGLRDKIPGILELTCGKNFSDRGQGYTHGLVVRFTDRAALEAYGPHPAHRHLVDTLINPIRLDTLVCDFVREV